MWCIDYTVKDKMHNNKYLLFENKVTFSMYYVFYAFVTIKKCVPHGELGWGAFPVLHEILHPAGSESIHKNGWKAKTLCWQQAEGSPLVRSIVA